MRVFLAVHLPTLQLEVFRPKWSPEPPQGSAVLEKDKVVIADSAARAAGIRLGMKRGGVLTLSPETEMHERDVGRESAAQREVGIALVRFSVSGQLTTPIRVVEQGNRLTAVRRACTREEARRSRRRSARAVG
ncbi:DNA polymerase Y family protein, partial [Paraburkholderia sp. BR13439]